jgi:hypothetical protein
MLDEMLDGHQHVFSFRISVEPQNKRGCLIDRKILDEVRD